MKRLKILINPILEIPGFWFDCAHHFLESIPSEVEGQPGDERGFRYSGREPRTKVRGGSICLAVFILISWLGYGAVAFAEEKPQAPEENIAGLQGKVDKKRLEKWLMLPPEQRKQLIDKYKILMNMSPAERKKLRENLERFKSLSPQQKEMLRKNWQRIKNLSVEQRQAIASNYKRWQKLSPQERQVLRQKHKRFIQMNPEERGAVLEKYKKWKGLPPQERQKILQRHRIVSKVL